MASTTSTSNPPLFLALFGLSPWLPPLQRPIRRFFSLLLDFSHGFHRVNVQSASLSRSFWTSACLTTASTSNPPLFLAPFGLQPASQPLQRPIRLFFSFLLDFSHGFHRVNVQSAAFSRSFWTFSMASTASTSNLTLFLTPFGLLPWFPPLQRPIRHIFLLSFYIYIRNALSKSLTLHPYLPQSSQRHTRQKTPAGTSPAGAFEKHTNY